MTDFCIVLQALVSWRTPMAPQGVRFNTNFRGEFTGPKVKGKLVGTDYWTWRANAVGLMNDE
jgi:hypothetical protein